MKFTFYQTFTTQFELLPRITIMYGGTLKGMGVEWLWFGVCYLNG